MKVVAEVQKAAQPNPSAQVATNVAALLPVLGSCLGFSPSFHKRR